MNTLIRKILFFDGITSALAGLIIIAVICIVTAHVFSGSVGKENNALKAQLTEMSSLAEGLVELKSVVESKEKKIGLSKTSGVVTTLEQTLKSLGLKATVIKPLTKNKVKEFTEEDAELELRNVDLNGIVNLLYKIDSSPAPMKIKNAAIKTTFEDPNKFTLKLTVSLLSKE
ncbi:MAG: hypothetical protein HZA14_00115 [Nitrospirae bacterium]|nr:hypothetical protein [Nitrospirota bacterium]